MTVPKIYKQAIEYFGKEKQIDMMIEECSELIQALCKHKRGLPSNVEEEMTDVSIMLMQLEHVFNIEVLDYYLVSKTRRLEKLLEEKQ